MEQLSKMRFGMVLVVLFAVSALSVYAYKGGRVERPHDATQEATLAAIAAGDEEALDHRLGDLNAPVTLFYYIDYDCPHCADFMATLERAVATYPSLRAIVRPLPLTDLHPTAYKKAVLAECLALQGEDFFAVSLALFTKQGVPASELSAADLHLSDPDALSACVMSPAADAKARTAQRGAALSGLYTTPSALLVKDGEVLATINYASPENLFPALEALVGTSTPQ